MHRRDCAYVTTDGPAPCTCGYYRTAEGMGLTAAQVAEIEVARIAWRQAMTTANNICMMRSEEINNDDGPPIACRALEEAAAEIRRWLDQDDKYFRDTLAAIRVV